MAALENECKTRSDILSREEILRELQLQMLSHFKSRRLISFVFSSDLELVSFTNYYCRLMWVRQGIWNSFAPTDKGFKGPFYPKENNKYLVLHEKDQLHGPNIKMICFSSDFTRQWQMVSMAMTNIFNINICMNTIYVIDCIPRALLVKCQIACLSNITSLRQMTCQC